MEKIFGAPQYYVQGPGVLSAAPLHMERLGGMGKTLVIADPGVVGCAKPLLDALEAAGCPYRLIAYGDSIRLSRIQALIDSLERDYVWILGVGGGRAIDVAKRVKWALGAKMLAVPTSIASDAAASRSAVAYGARDEIVEDVPVFGPEGILADTQVIVSAPLRLFAAGMADALSKRYEYLLSRKYGTGNWYGADPVFFLDGVSRQMHELLLDQGLYLRGCFERHTCNEAVERAVTAMLLMSRLVYDSGGLRGAHDMFEEFHDCGFGHAFLHGEIVGFFDLVQLRLEDAPPEEFERLYRLYRALDIPLRISGLGFDPRDRGALERLTGRMQEKLGRFGYDLSAERFQACLLELEGMEGASV